MVTTKAIVAHEPGQPFQKKWNLEDVQLGSPGDDEILVEIHASGICHTDLVLASLPAGAMGIQYPKVPGHEGAGIAKAVGQNVHGVNTGDPVLLSFNSCSSCQQCEAGHPAYCDSFAVLNYIGDQTSTTRQGNEKTWSSFFGQSSFAQNAIVKSRSVLNAKELLHNEEELKDFAPLGCGFQTGMGAIENTTQAGPEDVVLIAGLGAVGMGALMTAKVKQCKAIIAVDRVQARLDLATELGASHTINTSEGGFTTLGAAVRQIIPNGASIAIDTTGVPSIIEESVQATYTRGKIVTIGIPPPGYTLNIDVTAHLNSGRAILGCIEGDCDPKIAIPQMVRWYREGMFPIDKMIKFFKASEFDKAIESMHIGETIKPVLVWK